MNCDKMKGEYRKEHFIVPEGYFENFTEQMMAKLPEQPFQPMTVRRKSLLPQFAAAAAVVVVMVSAVALYFSRQDGPQYANDSDTMYTDTHEVGAMYSMEEAAHYAMMDNQTIHYMVSEQ